MRTFEDKVKRASKLARQAQKLSDARHLETDRAVWKLFQAGLNAYQISQQCGIPLGMAEEIERKFSPKALVREADEDPHGDWSNIDFQTNIRVVLPDGRRILGNGIYDAIAKAALMADSNIGLRKLPGGYNWRRESRELIAEILGFDWRDVSAQAAVYRANTGAFGHWE